MNIQECGFVAECMDWKRISSSQEQCHKWCLRLALVHEMSIYLSGVQPSGKFHIGNYFGCIKPFLSIRTDSWNRNNKNIFLVADMHCYTKPEKIFEVSNQVIESVRSLLAAGINPETTLFVRQSRVCKSQIIRWTRFVGIGACKSGLVSIMPHKIFSCREHDSI